MIHLESNTDNIYLDQVRYKSGYNPFSFKFNSELNKVLYEKAKANNANNSTLNIIHSGDYFHSNFHKPLFNELVATRNKISLSNDDLVELFIAFLNEQEFFNREEKKKFLNSLQQLTAFDLQQATIVRDSMPENPQNFTHLSEAIVDFGNLVLRYLFFDKSDSIEKAEQPDSNEALFNELLKIFQIANKYYNIKSHYDSCLFFNGNIEVSGMEKIYFDACTNDFYLIEQISLTIIENQRLNRLHYYKLHSGYNSIAKEMILNESTVRTLSDVVIEKGFIKYRLKKRTEEDYSVYLDYLVSVLDYYPFYSSKPLLKLQGLTINQLLRIHSELLNIATDLYFRNQPRNNAYNIEKFKIDFLPKIKHSVIKSYLLAVTNCTELQIESFLEIITIKRSEELDLFSAHLIRRNAYYFFPSYSLSHPNYFHLIDYWLEQAEESLEHRGTAFENYLKNQLLAVPQEENNKFRVIRKSKFISSSGKEEEVDLLIETKSTLIVGEIKCVKYPMHNRDYYNIFSEVIQKASNQLKRKSEFLLKNAPDFSADYSINGKRIVKVIVLNYPFFVSASIENISIVDGNFLLAYFKSGRMVSRSFDENGMEEHESVLYYSNEEEFCNNFENYLANHPMVNAFLPHFKKIESSYKLQGLPEIAYSNIVSTKGNDNISKNPVSLSIP